MKTVLITGATSGIGLALAKHYANHNYHVIACGRNTSVLAQLSLSYPNIEKLAFDITDAKQVEQAAASLTGYIDILICNAGDCEYIDDVKKFDSQLFQRIIQVNLISVGYLISSFINKIKSGGQIAFVSSMATLMPFPKAHAYGASKAGIDYLANTLRFDLQADNIKVSLIKPGFVKTALTDKNDFDMPFLITSEQAAQRIFHGIKHKKQNIIFPKRFHFLLAMMSYLPDFLWRNMFFKGADS